MLKLATTIKNPGEPAVDSRYHDSAHLAALGFNGRVLFQTTGLSGLPGIDAVADGELRRWVQGNLDDTRRTIEDSTAAGLAVYLFYDVLALPRDLVQRNVSGLTCKNRPGTLCPASDATFRHTMDGLDWLIQQHPAIAGVVLRFGDTDAQRLPHLLGNDIYSPHCPRCSQFGRADRVVHLLKLAHERVVQHHGKRLIARAWNVRPNGMHDTPDLARRIVDRLPGGPADDRLLLSFKFTQTDFWRYQPWNRASLACGGRPILYELQCQREFEGKGGIPNWQVPLWRDGDPAVESDAPSGLAAVADAANLAGVMAWVRGGGWGGPFVRDETWIDANVWAVPKLADDPKADPRELAARWVRERLSIDDEPTAEALVAVLERSPEMIRKAFYIEPFARNKSDAWHPSADWIQDDLVDATSAWRIIQRLPEADLDAAVREKEEAADAVAASRQELQQLVADRNHPEVERLIDSLIYAESLFEALRDLVTGLVMYRRWLKDRQPGTAEQARRKLYEAQSHWNHHAQRHGSAPGAATPFRESGFWEITQEALGRLG